MSDDLVKGDLEGIELGRTGGSDSDECCGCLAIVGREINALRQSRQRLKAAVGVGPEDRLPATGVFYMLGDKRLYEDKLY
ncbi:MAG: hypothetical protein DSY87_06400 [Methylococcus sp.]|nr:MAG: hypothetical protein DSY87_06400 [Methylococcus sp.]